MRLLWSIGFTAALLGAAPVAAQSVGVTTVRALDFGELLPGTVVRVPATDAGSRGEFVISGSGRVTILMELPAQLSGEKGTVLMAVGARDGLYQVNNGELLTFDPRSPLTVSLPSTGGSIVRVFFGGTLVVATAQPPGWYDANVTVQVVAG